MMLAVAFMYYDADRIAGKGPSLFGDTNYVRWIMFLRSVIGYGGIAFSFLAVEYMPMGDATVLVMLSPLVATIGGFIILGEPWRLPEFVATVVSLTGATLVAKPTFIFGNSNSSAVSDAEAANTATGVVLSLIAALCAGMAYVCVRMLGTVAKMPWANVCFVQALGQVGLSIPSLYLAGQHLTLNMSAYEYGLIVLVGFVGAWSQIAMTVGMQREKSALATGMRMSDVVFGFIWQALFTADPVSLLSVAGAVLVTASIIILVVFKQAPPPPAAATSEIRVDDGARGGLNWDVEMTAGRYPLTSVCDEEEGGDSDVGGEEDGEGVFSSKDARRLEQIENALKEGVVSTQKSAAGDGGAKGALSRIITATLRQGSSKHIGGGTHSSRCTASSSDGSSGGGGRIDLGRLRLQFQQQEPFEYSTLLDYSEDLDLSTHGDSEEGNAATGTAGAGNIGGSSTSSQKR